MNRSHVVDMRPARVAGRQLLASNDPKGEQQIRDAEFALLQSAPRVDPKCDLADQIAYERQQRFAHVTEVTGRPL